MRSHSWRTGAAALVLAISLASSVAAVAPIDDSRARDSAFSTTATIRIDNFGRVAPILYRGAQPQGRDYQDLQALGVKTIVNLTSDDAETDERAMAESVGLSYVQIPMSTHTVPTTAQLTEFLRIVKDPAQQPVYLHCVGGRHRTGVMTAVYRMSLDGWTANQAFTEMKQYKFGADFLHPEFKDFVFRYRADDKSPASSATLGTP